MAIDRAAAKAAGYTEAEIDNYERMTTKVSNQDAGRVVGNPYVESLLQGATFGFSDELQAGAQSLWDYAKSDNPNKGYRDIYNANLGALRGAQGQFQREHQGTDLALQVAGGLLTGKALAGPVMASTAGMSAIPRIAATSAPFGALAGAGYSEGDTLGEVASDTARGAAVATAVGYATQPIASFVQNRVIQPIVNKISYATKSGKQQAAQKLIQALERDGVDPSEALTKLKALGPGATIADVGGPNTKGLAQAVYSVPGQSRKLAEEALKERSLGSSTRLINDLRKFSGANKNVFTEMKTLVATRAEEAKPLYNVAFGKTVSNDVMDDVLNQMDDLAAQYPKSRIGQAVSSFKSSVEKSGKTIGKHTKQWDVRALDAIKKDTDDKINALMRAGQKQRASVLIQAKNILLSKLDDSVPEYGQARKIYSDDSRVIDAMEAGKRILRDDFEMTEDVLASMSRAEHEAFLLGSTRTIRDKLLDIGAGRDASNKLGSQLVRERLRNAFPDNASFEKFMTSLERERTFAETRNIVLSGSQTQYRQEGLRDALSPISDMESLAQGTPSGVINAARSFFSTETKLPEPVRNQLANMLFKQGFSKQFLDKAVQNGISAEKIARLREQMATAAIVSTSAQAGRAASQF